MTTNRVRIFVIVMLLVLIALPRTSKAGIAMDCEGTIESWVLGGYYKSGDCYCSGGQPVCKGGAGGSSSSGHSGGLSTENAIKLQLFQGVLDGLVNGMLAAPSVQTQKQLPPIDHTAGKAKPGAAEKLRQQFDSTKTHLLSDMKGLEAASGDGDLESLAAGARKPFDTAGDFKLPESMEPGGATPFFGDTMPLADIQLLVDPESDPRVVDLRQANAFLVGNLKADSRKQDGAAPPAKGEERGGPIVRPPDCAGLARKLDGYLQQRQRFMKTVDMAREQLETWEEANRNALVTAAKDGLEYFTGELLEGLSKRGEAAERLQRIYNANAAKMAEKGLNVADLEAKIQRLRLLSSAGQTAELRSNLSDWQGFIKDGASALLARLGDSNREIRELLDDPRMQEYVETETPELNALLDISKIAAANKVFGTWVAKKVPIIAGVELSIKQSYNALDWFLSFKRVTEANRINGTVLAAAKSLQADIDDTSLALRGCR